MLNSLIVIIRRMMNSLQNIYYWFKVGKHRLQRQSFIWHSAQNLRESLPLDELHNDIGCVICLKIIQDIHDVWAVMKQLHFLGFLIKASFLFSEKIFISLSVGDWNYFTRMVASDKLNRKVFLNGDFTVVRYVKCDVDNTETALPCCLAYEVLISVCRIC